jgi:hypothetical protein
MKLELKQSIEAQPKRKQKIDLTKFSYLCQWQLWKYSTIKILGFIHSGKNHKYSKLAQYQNLALVPNKHRTTYFQQVGEHSQMTSVELGKLSKTWWRYCNEQMEFFLESGH